MAKPKLSSCCDSCHSLPPSLYCRSDAAYLCINCDSTIHSANSLARRHHRVPLLPIPSGGLIAGGISVAQPKEDDEEVEEEEEEEEKVGFFLGGEVNEYFDLVEFSTCCEEEGREKYEGREEEDKRMLQSFQMGYEGINKGIDCSSSIGHTESLSSTEATVVTEDSIQIPQQLSSMDREARVLRYREKRKTRKFQKVIRYASRKAYAETRPRIKGRFVKRTDAELEVDQMFAASHVMVEAGFGVVHSY